MLQNDFSFPLVRKAMEYGIHCHHTTNHFYDNKPYSAHLKMVYDYGCKYAHLLAKDEVELALAGCWVHDTIEDCRQTYNDVKNACGPEVAEIAYALTNEKGKNRKERANDKYYEGIRQHKLSIYVKLCDRLANTRYSAENNQGMLAVYGKEMKHFQSALWEPAFAPMFEELNQLVS